ncbi:MAG: hypothetical protein ACYCV7_03470 [Acidimicrobiales bacterium]
MTSRGPDSPPREVDDLSVEEVRAAVEHSEDELRLTAARLQGEVESTRVQVASLEAAVEQLRSELAASREDALLARSDLGHMQRRADDRVRTAEHRAELLQAELDEERSRCRAAVEERSAVIAALGRRARRRLGAPDTEDIAGPTGNLDS